MIPVHQRIHGNGQNGQPYGDCLKCCVASILELPYEEVPHFAAGEWKKIGTSGTGWLFDLNDWLETRGGLLSASANYYYKYPERMTDEYVLEVRPRNWHATWWIGAVVPVRNAGYYHAVVMDGASVVHDPGLEKPRAAYEFLGEVLLLLSDPSRARV